MLLMLATGLPSPVHAQNYTADETRRLNAGEVVTRYWKVPGKELGTGWAAGVIDASPEAVFAVVADMERYPQIFPRMIKAKVLRRSARGYDFFYRIDMPWPLDDHWCITRNTHQIDNKKRRYRRRWHMLKGTFVINKGSWLVYPWGVRKAVLYYSVTLKPKVTAPDFVLDHVSRVALPRSVKAMRGRVQKLKRLGTLRAITR